MQFLGASAEEGPGDQYPFDLRPLLELSAEGRATVERLAGAIRTPLAAGDPRLHHYVARSYQARFAKQGEIVRVVLDEPISREILPIKSVAVMKDLYTTIAKDVGETVAIERIFAQVDGDFVRVLDHFISGEPWPPTREDRMALATWASLQRVRTPTMRRQFEVVADSLTKMQLSLITDEDSARAHLRQIGIEPDELAVEALLEAVANMDQWEVVPHQNEMVRTMLDVGLHSMPYFLGRKVTVVRFPEEGLMISDNPVVMDVSAGTLTHGLGLGLATADEVWIPMNRSTALVLHNDEGLEEVVVDAPLEFSVDELNQLIASQAHREIYCHPDDVWRLDDLELPHSRRPLLTMDGGDWVKATADGMNSPPTRRGHHRYRKER